MSVLTHTRVLATTESRFRMRRCDRGTRTGLICSCRSMRLMGLSRVISFVSTVALTTTAMDWCVKLDQRVATESPSAAGCGLTVTERQVRMQDVREMLARLGLKLSVLVRTNCTGGPASSPVLSFALAHSSIGCQPPCLYLQPRISKRNQFGVQEATEVLWEADDDHTGALDVQDLVELYFRVTTDATGYEPRRLFCMLEFLLFSAPSVCLVPF
eukprot:COSAG02_NODE_3270_length_7035_cov_21.981978_5_plen_214_part_00